MPPFEMNSSNVSIKYYKLKMYQMPNDILYTVRFMK